MEQREQKWKDTFGLPYGVTGRDPVKKDLRCKVESRALKTGTNSETSQGSCTFAPSTSLCKEQHLSTHVSQVYTQEA